jgi:hypothetical protein
VHKLSQILVFCGAVVLAGCDQKSSGGNAASGISANPNHTWFPAFVCGTDPHNIVDICDGQDCSQGERSPAQVIEFWRSNYDGQGPIDLHIEDQGNGRVDVVAPDEKRWIVFFTTREACKKFVAQIASKHNQDLAPYQ